MRVLEGLAELRAAFRGLVSTNAPAEAWQELGLKVFRFQHAHNPTYRAFCSHLGLVDSDALSSTEDIPFLPVELFSRHDIRLDGLAAVGEGLTFRSSGTTGSQPSVHWLDDPDWYAEVARVGAQRALGPLHRWDIHALLPGYLERSDSSLVHMVVDWIRHVDPSADAGQIESHFHLHDHTALAEAMTDRSSGRGKLLIGVTHALLDWAEGLSVPLPGAADWLVLETGGMKGRRKESIRPVVHQALRERLGVKQVGSEYGMTEMLSQAYALSNGRFVPPPWLQIRIRETDDPGNWAPAGRQGRICVMDLANLHSCAFLATGDLGRLVPGVEEAGAFEVLGRHDHAEVRGCNLMVSDLA